MEGGLLPSDLYQLYQQQQQQMMMSWFSSPPPPTAVTPPSYSPANLPHSMDQSLTNLLEKQRNETDQYLRLQSNQFRATLYQQRKQHMASLLLRLESKASLLLGQKESELMNARKRIMEVEARLRRVEEERETWQRIARENEAMAVSLNRSLEKVREPCLSSTGASSPDADTSASCSGHPLALKEPREGMRMGLCKSCGSRYSRVLLLPCRHLCACELCDAVLDSCPFCGSVKEGSIEVFLV
ncbi:BOI-related E3 ubiquitin-protein ligase 1 [Elaeis guineensis]|uniref:E3 ubiquitin-protein ligase BOI n=1 Tax=Elaeis guineensis var. tenera TaxID=51953 RepID=A0A6J0PHM1_ELAGV|nr:E3 ubiquitin-protein ligase BOI [Elaeis guineensis]